MSAPRELVVVHSVGAWLEQTQTWIYNQIRFLGPAVESHVVCDRTRNLAQFALPNVHAASSRPRAARLVDRAARALRLRRYPGHLVGASRALGAAVVHSHFGTAGWADLDAIERLGIRHVVTFYGFDVTCMPRIDRRWHERYRRLFGRVDRVLCEGPHMAACVERLGCPQDKIRVHHLGVDVDRIAFRPRAWDGRGPLRVLLAASFRPKKGLPDALEALGRFHREHEVEVTLIGDATDNPASRIEKTRILAAIERHRLGRHVRRLGFQPHTRVLAEAASHHVFMQPSLTAPDGDTEGGAPVALIEMAATGLAVVATRHCDIPEVVVHGRTGLLAEERDVDGLLGHLQTLAGDPAAWASMARRGRRRIERDFAAAAQGEHLTGIYRGIAAP